MKKVTIGIIAHVDSGKTTLSEALLYKTGVIRNFGRVDKGDSFLDDNSMERKRGITIYSKQASFEYGNSFFYLIDTPGHSDFASEMERALPALDYAILLISASDGIKGQTETIWRVLEEYKIPTIIFFNKMDQGIADKSSLLENIKTLSKDRSVDFCFSEPDEDFYEQLSMCSEAAMDEFLSDGAVSDDTIKSLILHRDIFPCCFGSALKMDGIDNLLTILDKYTLELHPFINSGNPDSFGGRVFKISRLDDGTRLTFVKITSGCLKNKTILPDGDSESKINQIRLYSGSKYTPADTVFAGDVCALTGLKKSYAGQPLGSEDKFSGSILAPVLNYSVHINSGQDIITVLPYFKALEEENPELSVTYDEDKNALSVCVMGQVQLEILSALLKERYNIDAGFDIGEVMYKETIAAPVYGVGHFEPLRHYAEVVLLLEPLPPGSGLVFESNVKHDRLASNWQRLILTHLKEKRHKGVLTGSLITDIKISLVDGKAHIKHTEGGDFRQASYRAVRQGLMMAESILLEPFYQFTLEIPQTNLGHALNDLQMMGAEFSAPDISTGRNTSVISGRAPVSKLMHYPQTLTGYTKGLGSIKLLPGGYAPSANTEEIIAEKNYDPLRDTLNSADSVFCHAGTSDIVPYDRVVEFMHLSLSDITAGDSNASDINFDISKSSRSVSSAPLGTDEVDKIIGGISRGNNSVKNASGGYKKKTGSKEAVIHTASGPLPKFRLFSLEESDIILVDGYNVIFAWPELNAIAKDNIDGARDALLDTLSKYSAMTDAEIIAVFDAYRVKGHVLENASWYSVKVVFTREDETADRYIERFTNENGRKKKVSVITSDGAEQIITRGHGCRLVSSREFKNHLDTAFKELNKKYDVK